MSLLEQVEGKDYDDRTVSEQLQDLGLEKETITLDKIRWVRPYASHPKAGLVTVGKTSVGLPAFVVDDLGDRALVGTGKYQGNLVLLIRSDDEGYKIHNRKESNKGIMTAPGMIGGADPCRREVWLL